MGSCPDYLITSAVVKNLSASAGDASLVSIPGSQRSLGVGSGNPFQYSNLREKKKKKTWTEESGGL